ncbi:MAG: hypothetical protein Ct9H300mP11_00210 [Chloroflexota bacterium]|nr:MAG: hypothetical protein Ct9H300mP11_00210 [Chloroflexota bacterium]
MADSDKEVIREAVQEYEDKLTDALAVRRSRTRSGDELWNASESGLYS